MTFSAEVRAVADSEELLEQLFAMMAADMHVQSAHHGVIEPNRKNRLGQTWFYLHFVLEYADPPWIDFPLSRRMLCWKRKDENSYDISWEYCMKRYEKLLRDNGCIKVVISNSEYPDYRVYLLTANTLYHVIIYDSENKDELIKHEWVLDRNPEPYAATNYCEGISGIWSGRDFEAKAPTGKTDQAAARP